MNLKNLLSLIIVVVLFNSNTSAQDNLSKKKNVIYLSWDQVIDISQKDNLSIQSKALEYEAQNLEEWRAISSFIPTFSYSGLAIKNLELPVFVFMGQRIVVGTNYSIQHSFDLTLPIFTGGARWFNLSAQKSLRKSLSEELKGKEEETVLSALQAYYGIMLTNELYKTSREAAEVAKNNLEQVQKFYNVGTATELDVRRAKAQYSSTLPQMESAASNRYLSYQRLKTILNISLDDSLVISDSLSINNFLKEYSQYSLDELKDIAIDQRKDLKSISHKLDAAKNGERIAIGQFAPMIALSASLTHQAQFDTLSSLSWKDYIRSKSVALSIQWPIFEGGKKVIDYQLAKVQSDQMKILYNQSSNFAVLDVEEKYFNHREAIKNLASLQDAMEQSKESMRISDLMYESGMSTQLEVLSAQLLYTQSKTSYLQGIFNYNISQLALLQSVGLLEKIWK